MDVVHGVSLFSDYDIYLFKQGTHSRLYDCMGSHLIEADGAGGVLFSVWAPNALEVCVVGDFNGWDNRAHKLTARWDLSGIYEGFIPELQQGTIYKYGITGPDGQYLEKGDPFALTWEVPPKSASVVWDNSYDWGDGAWSERKAQREINNLSSPFLIYEMHMGSWMHKDGFSLSYRELAVTLVDYIKEMGFTHVEFLPVMEHPFYASWGYQSVGYFAPSSRFGTPQDFMYLIDALHNADIGVILDWVPSHFPNDGHGLANFDGTCLYEHEDPRQGFHPDWKSAVFNYGRNEVRSFLASSAGFWLDKYHADGLRVDAVASMLYLDYSRKQGEWIPNIHGGRENLEAVSLLQHINSEVYTKYPGIQTIAEESTSWPMVSRPPYIGGLGFGMKWNMGWMHDVLAHFARDPIHRRWHWNELTFGMWYAYTENFVLALSHDEVVHGKGSLWQKMNGDWWQKFANLRLLYGWMYAHPGKKLLFMGGEFGQSGEWSHDKSLDWGLLEFPTHRGIKKWVQDLNHFTRSCPAMYELDFSKEGFEWIDCNDPDGGIISCVRKDAHGNTVLCVGNFTPLLRHSYRIGLPTGGYWEEVLNSDAHIYGGSDNGNGGGVHAEAIHAHGRNYSADFCLPSLSFQFFVHKG